MKIKQSLLLGEKKTKLGEGVFLSDEAPVLKAGDILPVFVWGKFKPKVEVDAMPKDQLKSPGAFQLKSPYLWQAVLLDERCPAGKVNDARGTGKSVNIGHTLYLDLLVYCMIHFH